MGYYSDTTKKLMDQIGNPYTTRVQNKNAVMPDFTSLILTMALMPQLSKAVAAGAGNPDPNLTSEVALMQRGRDIDPRTGTFYPSVYPQETYPKPTIVSDVVKDSMSSVLNGPDNAGGLLQSPMLMGLLRLLFGQKR